MILPLKFCRTTVNVTAKLTKKAKLLVCFVEMEMISFTGMYTYHLFDGLCRHNVCVLKDLYTITKSHVFVSNNIHFKLHIFFFKCALIIFDQKL